MSLLGNHRRLNKSQHMTFVRNLGRYIELGIYIDIRLFARYICRRSNMVNWRSHYARTRIGNRKILVDNCS